MRCLIVTQYLNEINEHICRFEPFRQTENEKRTAKKVGKTHKQR